MRGLLRAAETRLAALRGSELNALDASAFGERLCARFARLTAVAPSVPPPPQKSLNWSFLYCGAPLATPGK